MQIEYNESIFLKTMNNVKCQQWMLRLAIVSSLNKLQKWNNLDFDLPKQRSSLSTTTQIQTMFEINHQENNHKPIILVLK